jgi:hypothetical protein
VWWLASIPRSMGFSSAAPTSRCLLQLSLGPGFVARNNISARRSRRLSVTPGIRICQKWKTSKLLFLPPCTRYLTAMSSTEFRWKSKNFF